MSNERRQILEMLAAGKISADEAERLLEALNEPEPKAPPAAEEACCDGATATCKPKYLYVLVNPKHDRGRHKDKVNIRIPLGLVKAGIKLGSFLPDHARTKIHGHLHDKGLDLDLKNMDSQTVDQLAQALSEMSIDVDDEDETVKIYCA